MMVDVMCGLMSGAQSGPHVRRWGKHDVPADLGQFFIAVDPECFAPGMGQRLQALMTKLRASEGADPSKPILVPGDPERICVAEVEKLGAIKYTENHITSYRDLAKKLGVKPMLHMEK